MGISSVEFGALSLTWRVRAMTRYHGGMNSLTTRFAPSPSGLLHLGNARTALFSLLAALPDGRFLLRIEDSDRARVSPAFEAALRVDLEWLGFGAYIDEAAIWRQSERSGVYNDFLERLAHENLVYPCFCAESELVAERASLRARGLPPRYSGRCAALKPADARSRIMAGERAVWRFRVPPGQEVGFCDVVRGPQRMATNLLGDFVVRRANGEAMFFFANALDDALSGVTLVLRGEDHLANTPRQILILRALGLPVPDYGHLPLVLSASGVPLSKRDGAGSLAALREEGFLPLAVVNYLARLGAVVESERLLPLVELAQAFDRRRIGHAPAHYDRDQLLHWQRLAMAATPVAEWALWVAKHVPQADRLRFVEAVRPNALFPEDYRRWAEIMYGERRTLDDDARAAIVAAGGELFRAAVAHLDAGGVAGDLPAVLKAAGHGGRRLFHGLRAALTGRVAGPELKDILALMPRALVARRLRECGSTDAKNL